MKHIVLIAGLVTLFSAAPLEAQTPTPKPGPEHKKLNIWVGDWTYEGDLYATPLGPAGKCVGKSTVRPILGGFFVEFQGQEKGPTGPFQWQEVDAYDAATKKYTWTGYGSDGSISAVTYTIDDTTVNYTGTILLGEKHFKIRGTILFTADFMSFTEKRELTEDGQTWMPVFESKSTRSKKGLEQVDKKKK